MIIDISAMQFNIDQDTGASISAWVAPDNPDMVPKVLLSATGHDVLELPANRSRPDIRDLGLHTTGMVGFWIDNSMVPDLEAWSDLQIREARSNLLLHRRHDGIPLKLFMLDTSMTASASLAMQSIVQQHFTLSYDAVERHPYDTLFALLNNQAERSIFACGRPQLTRYSNILRLNGFVCAALLKHPFEELGCRLEIAHDVARGTQGTASQYCAGLEPLVELMQRVNLGDLSGLQSAMRSLTPAQATVIANPLVKILACTDGEPPNREHVAVALDNLAAMDLVGSYDRFDSFKLALSEIANRQVFDGHQPGASFAAKEIAGVLARMESVRKLLALDLALHSYVEDAFIAAESELSRRLQSSDGAVL